MRGRDKAALAIGGVSFLRRLIGELAGFDEVLISAASAQDYEAYGLPVVEDIFNGCGPIGGLHAALTACRSDALLAVACDMPLFTGELARYIRERMSPEYDASVCVTRDGKLHPLCGIYKKRAARIFKQQIEAGVYQIIRAWERMSVQYQYLAESPYSDELLTNINTPEQYDGFRARSVRPIPAIAFVGYSGSGKTTLIEKLIPLLRREGLRVAAIKHDAHGFDMDREGKDTWRFSRAGAEAVAICSERRFALIENRAPDPGEMISRVRGVDLILLEGFKDGPYPKIAVLREASGHSLAVDSSRLLGAASDFPLNPDVLQFPLDDPTELARFLIA